LEDPKIPEHLFPVKLFGVFDRVTINESTLKRLKDDIIKMLTRAEKFGIWKAIVSDKPSETTKSHTKKNKKAETEQI